jgi:hypothetical protein
MPRKGFVYIAGPYRGPLGTHDHSEYFVVDAHINRAREWAAKFARVGIPFFCPHLNSAHFEIITPDVPAGFWLDMNLEVLAKASALFLMPGWGNSDGAIKEQLFAVDRHITIFYLHQFDYLMRWWREEAEDAD